MKQDLAIHPDAGLRAIPQDEAARLQSRGAIQRVSALGEMTAGLAHDFRNILAIIQAAINVAKRAGADSPNGKLAWAAIDDALARGGRLTSELLVFARGGKPDVQTENLNDLLTGSATFMKYGAGPGIQVTLDLAPTLPDCRIDRAQFNAAILNLVVNARDAMPTGGEIRIATDECPESCGQQAPRRWVRVRVSDEGSGMSPEIVEHLFDPYFTTKGEGGTGLGVPQVVAFVRASGGTICVSTEPGAGTCFDLRFPAADQTAQADGSQWRQLDRWVNEGGSVGQDEAPSARHDMDGLAESLRRSAVARKRNHADRPIADRTEHLPAEARPMETSPSRSARSIKPAVAAPPERHVS
jgi:signal transduction histidine kinase